MADKKEILKNTLDKVKMVDAGVKNKYGSLSTKPSSIEEQKDKKYYPSLYLNSKEAPILKGCETGCEVTILVEAKIRSHSVNEDEDNKNESFTLEIHKMGVVSTNHDHDSEGEEDGDN